MGELVLLIAEKLYFSLPREEPGFGSFSPNQAAKIWAGERARKCIMPQTFLPFQMVWFLPSLAIHSLGFQLSSWFLEYSQLYFGQYTSINLMSMWVNEDLQLSIPPSCWCHQLFLDKGKKAFHLRNHSLFIKWSGINGYTYATSESLPSFTPYTQFCRWGYRQNGKNKSYKTSRIHKGKSLWL